MTTDLVLAALDKAYEVQKPKHKMTHHSDRGSRYTSDEYWKKPIGLEIPLGNTAKSIWF
ncbi:hypothetical protein ACFPYJ_32450 [Paenibacillus solisilvae]|uniref:Integrase catalytic domain-containing protein n=1 Tax=Paenibacillus solisilvae TaxID=2486751 RepID=A0ABW0W6B2_9BACL